MDNKKRDNGDTSLTKLLQQADLTSYETKLRANLKLRNAEDLQYVEELDLSGIGMSRPEQKRLRKEYEKMYPKGVVGKLKKVFGRSESDKKEGNSIEIEEDQHIISPEKISLCKELGRGEFGSVWQASWRHSHNNNDIIQVAVKCVDPGKFSATSSSFLQEAAIMTRMRHDNVVRLFGVVLDTKRVMMVSELATCGSLLECLHKPALKDSFPVHVLCDYAEQICRGMAYLESQRLIHRDLAARNVLVFSPKKIKISDFGLSRSLGVGEDYYKSEFSLNLRLPIAWCAPECINFLKFTSASDVWAFAVTLWEMFTYGQMPWNGMIGAEILDAVDRQKRILPRPDCCPEDVYETMKECWLHNPHNRPTFAELVVQFPEKQPQTVRAVCDFNDKVVDHLSFKKDDLITVIQKAPSAYPDGYYWFGSLRNGKMGLFRPADTVAHLGAENPSTGEIIGNSCVPAGEKKEKKSSKKSKEEEREKRKALISEPVGAVHHTCHVGIDGYAFGLLQLDKKEMTLPGAAASPEGRRSLGNKSQSSVNGGSGVPLRPEMGREGVALRDTMSLREVISPNSAMSPPTSRSHPSRSSLQPSAPPMSNDNTMNKNMRDVFEELNTSLRSLEYSATSMTPLIQDDSSGEFRRPQPICAVYARSPRNGHRSPPATMSDNILTAEVEHLERDLTEFSLSSMSDRPLLPKIEKQSKEVPLPTRILQTGSSVRTMTTDEVEKWQNKQNREHKKVETILSDMKKKELTESTEELDRSLMSSLREKQSEPMEWSAEAQEAYKLLVECGTNLKQTHSPSASPIPSRMSTIDKKEQKRVTIIENNSKNGPPPRPITPPHEENTTSYSPTKRIHIIETKLLPGPAADLRKDEISPPTLPPKGVNDKKPPVLPPKVRQVPITVDGRMNYDNLNGIGAGAKNPPPVPPKPKVNIQRPSASPPPSANMNEERESPGMAPAIARIALFTGQNKEEVVKF